MCAFAPPPQQKRPLVNLRGKKNWDIFGKSKWCISVQNIKIGQKCEFVFPNSLVLLVSENLRMKTYEVKYLLPMCGCSCFAHFLYRIAQFYKEAQEKCRKYCWRFYAFSSSATREQVRICKQQAPVSIVFSWIMTICMNPDSTGFRSCKSNFPLFSERSAFRRWFVSLYVDSGTSR